MEKHKLDVVSSSAVQLSEKHATPRALTVEEIRGFLSDFAQAARNAMTAGFDGVELHGANGYLIDQFTQSTCNQRTDLYGGSVENRSRFALEATQAVVEAIGADKVGIRLSPWSDFYGMRMEDPISQFTHLIDGLKKLKLAYLHLVESRIAGASDREGATESLRVFIERWGNDSPVLAAGGFKGDDATRHYIDEEYADAEIAIVIGRPFTSNPDLPFRIKHGIKLRPYDRSKFYTHTYEGYTDFAFSEEFETTRHALGNVSTI